MDKNDIDVVKSIFASMTSTEEESKVFEINNPSKEVEHSLVDFLKHRLTKLKEDVDFEDDIKNAVLARLSEATFPQLITLLEILQKNSNIGVEKVLAPFIASSGEKTILDSTKEMNKNSQLAEKVFEETDDKNILQSLTMLNQLLEMSKNKKSENKESANGNDN